MMPPRALRTAARAHALMSGTSCTTMRASAEGKRLFAEALADGTMECYFPLAAQFRTRTSSSPIRTPCCLECARARVRTHLLAAAVAGIGIGVATTALVSMRACERLAEDEPAYCGLTTLVMTLNALNIDPRRLWKGPWRWYTEDMVRYTLRPRVCTRLRAQTRVHAPCAVRPPPCSSTAARRWTL
ncbi:hypothetical protein EON66_01370 [archaeon]|nr:MAG: hypothetical protein EON66_01370 [archaeon]